MTWTDPVPTCRRCRADLPAPLISFPDLPIAGVYLEADHQGPDPTAPLDWVRCAACGFVQLGQALAAGFYAQYKFAGGHAPGYLGHLERFADAVAGALPPGAAVLEVGCGDGSLLRRLADRGLAVRGIEPADGPRGLARQKGLDVEAAPRKEETRVQAVVMRHVLEHIDDFPAFFAGFQGALGDDTLLVVEVPDLGATVRGELFSNVYHPHPGYFDRDSLAGVLGDQGWQVLEAGEVDVFGGSLLVTAARGPRPAPGIAWGPAPTPATPAELEAFVASWRRQAEAFTAFLDELRAQGQRVEGYGAAERTTAQLGAAGVTRDQLGCLYDRNPALHGRCLPGSRIPVRTPADLAADPPDVLVILARSYEDEIVAGLQDFLAGGGRVASLRTSPPSLLGPPGGPRDA